MARPRDRPWSRRLLHGEARPAHGTGELEALGDILLDSERYPKQRPTSSERLSPGTRRRPRRGERLPGSAAECVRAVRQRVGHGGRAHEAPVDVRPRGDVFLVHNHNLRDVGDRWLKESNQFLIKVQYAIVSGTSLRLSGARCCAKVAVRFPSESHSRASDCRRSIGHQAENHPHNGVDPWCI